MSFGRLFHPNKRRRLCEAANGSILVRYQMIAEKRKARIRHFRESVFCRRGLFLLGFHFLLRKTSRFSPFSESNGKLWALVHPKRPSPMLKNIPLNTPLYGYNCIVYGYGTQAEDVKQAWFFTRAAAERFKKFEGLDLENAPAFGGIKKSTVGDILADEERPAILDSPDHPWFSATLWTSGGLFAGK